MKHIAKLFSSRAMILWLVLYAVVMAVATIVETKYSTAIARQYIYEAWWFALLHVVLIVNFVVMSVQFKLWKQRKFGVLILHYAFAVIALGAMVTHLTGQEGILHIREGESSRTIIDKNMRKIGELPFDVKLLDFTLTRYPGSSSPSSYESELEIDGKRERVYMNNIVYQSGYRLYQSSYDHDEQGTVLAVNRDAVGTVITYIGYVLLLLGMVLSLVHRGSYFRVLLRSLGVVMLVVGSLSSMALECEIPRSEDPVSQVIVEDYQNVTSVTMEPQADDTLVSDAQPDVALLAGTNEGLVEPGEQQGMALEYVTKMSIAPEAAERFGKLMVQTSGGRIEPFDTYSSKIVRKISRENTLFGLSANQVLLGVVTQPAAWSYVPMIKFDGRMISFRDVLDAQGNYIYQAQVDQVYEKPVAERNKKDKEILKLDERVNILNALFTGRMLSIFPLESSPNHQWFSPGDDLSGFQDRDSMFVSMVFGWYAQEAQDRNWTKVNEIADMIEVYQNAKSTGLTIDKNRVQAEIFYNRIEVFKWSGFSYMALGLLMVLMLIVTLLRPVKWLKRVLAVLTVLAVCVFVWHSFGIALRWYISERAPWTNAYESMVFVGWTMALAGLLFVRKSRLTFALAVFFAGVVLFVSNLNWMDPEITPLVPVLKSYWLMLHVAAITGSYGFFGIGFLLGVISLLMMSLCREGLERQIRELTTINQLTMTLGLVLLTTGTFIGAVWANESWGRYWGWDPKETWALITMIVYTLVTHARFVPALRSDYVLGVMSVVALGAVLMTFFGVNYYLSGLHSYGGDSAPPAIYVIYIVYGVVAVIALVAWRNKRTR